MKKFEVLPHVADLRLRVEGSTQEELFCAAIEGMAKIMLPDFKLTNDFILKSKIEISAIDSTALLIDLLSEVLTLSHMNKAIYTNVRFESIMPNSLRATIFGNSVEAFSEDIKAVTYHEAEIKKNKVGNFETIIVFDI